MELNGNGAYALELQGVNHHYGTRQILFDLSLKLPPNRIYGLLGRNGAGKTTLINLISAQIFQSFGKIGANSGRDPGQTLVFGEKAFENRLALMRICVVRV